MNEYDKGAIEALFNLSLEVEGLLSLLQRREDMAPDELLPLLKEKASALALGIESLLPTSSGINNPTGEAEPSRPILMEADSVPSLPGMDDIVVPQITEEDDDQEKIADATLFEEKEIADGVPADSQSSPYSKPRNEAMESSAENIEDAQDEETLSENRQNEKGDLKRMLTLNDRFRFRRELFANSETDFADALNIVGAMESLDEAEEYFYNDLGWTRDDETVMEFMDIVIRFFSK